MVVVTSQGDEECSNDKTGGREHLMRAGGHSGEGWGPSGSDGRREVTAQERLFRM